MAINLDIFSEIIEESISEQSCNLTAVKSQD